MKRWQQQRQQGFGIIEMLIILVIILVLIAVGWVAFRQASKKDNTSQTTTSSSQQQQQKAEEKQKQAKPAEAQQPAPAPPAKGTITGRASYPSEALPQDQEVCAELISNRSIVHCVNVGKTQTITYTLEVPEGDYHVFSRVSPTDTYKAYYNEFVTCGLNVNCPVTGHQKLHTVSVKAGQTVKDVDPGDWYDN